MKPSDQIRFLVLAFSDLYQNIKHPFCLRKRALVHCYKKKKKKNEKKKKQSENSYSLKKIGICYTVKVLNFRTTKIQIKMSFQSEICPKGADGIANSVDPDQTAPQGAV